ncbi:MAG: hypothetical protein VSS75_016800 [Candidatus Parabeggiatoa sp.]|nr:hypothetical protein [Candidatus Parabeggiatoa sp.]
MITTVKSAFTNHLSHFAKMFPDDYQTSEHTLSNAVTRQTFIKV